MKCGNFSYASGIEAFACYQDGAKGTSVFAPGMLSKAIFMASAGSAGTFPARQILWNPARARHSYQLPVSSLTGQESSVEAEMS